MTMNCDTLAVVFTDVCDADRVYADLGDAEARKLGARSLKLVAEAARRNGGRLIKTIGDGAMITFRAVEEAYRAASIIQLAMRGQAVQLKIGMHFGQVIMTGDDIFGDTVNVAARVLARAGAGEILMTRECVDTLGPLQRATVRLLDTTSVKGRPEWVEIFRVIGESENVNVTTVVASSAAPAEQTRVLVLTYRDQTVRVESTGGPFRIGRDAGSNLVIASAWSSRSHATIDMQRDRFVITDHSSNGTFVAGDDGAERYLKREQQQLAEHGVISVGITAAGNPRDLVHYRCEVATKPAADSRSIAARRAYHEGVTVLAESDGPVTVFRTPSLADRRPMAMAG
jgi:class 3 adenylate cyclase